MRTFGFGALGVLAVAGFSSDLAGDAAQAASADIATDRTNKTRIMA
jgi:hypothetical protein